MPPERPASAVRRVGRSAPPPFSRPLVYDGPFQRQEGRGPHEEEALARSASPSRRPWASSSSRSAGCPYFLAGIATTRRFQFPDKENAGLTPASFQLASEDVAFRSADGVELEGWWVPAPGAKGTVVMVHGLNRSRIEMVRRAPFVHAGGLERAPLRPAPPRRERGRGHDLRGEGEGGRRGRRAPRARALPGAGRALGRVARGGLGRASPRPRTPRWRASSATAATARSTTRCGTTCSCSAASGGGCASCPAGRWRTWPSSGWAGAAASTPPPSDVRAAAAHLTGRPALFVANSDDRRMPKEIAFDLQGRRGAGRRGADRARQEPRRRVARRDGRLRGGRRGAARGHGAPRRSRAGAGRREPRPAAR